MIKGKNIVCFAYTTWEGDFVKSVVELLARLAGHNKILFVEYPFTIKDTYSAMRGAKVPDAKRVLGLKPRLKSIKTPNGHEVYLLTVPPTIPYAFIKDAAKMKRMLKFNASLIVSSVRKAIRKLDMDEFILLNSFNPFYGYALLNKLGEQSNIYYCFDSLNERRYGTTGLEIEKEFMKEINGIIVSSDYLKEIKSKINPNCLVVKNGVDYQTFYDYFQNNKKEVKKKVGYIGSLDFRFEAEMIAWVARQMPDYEFEFVGRIANEKQKAKLEGIQNIKFYPPVKPHEVPSIMFNCDVGIIPYTRIDENKSIYPLKINEYLSVGTPVVRTNFAHLPEFDDMVSMATTKEEFLEKIKYEIENDSAMKQKERAAFASRNSWESRAEAFGDAIVELSKL